MSGEKMQLFKNFRNKNIVTNFDYIKSLNAKELSEFLMSNWFTGEVCKVCLGEYDRCGDFPYCESNILKWLKKKRV